MMHNLIRYAEQNTHQCWTCKNRVGQVKHVISMMDADPPYMLSTRHGKQYSVEMTDADHAELLEALKQHISPVLISGYDRPLYTELLDGWHRRKTTTTDQKARVRQECLWMNFDPPEQTSLFDISGERL